MLLSIIAVEQMIRFPIPKDELSRFRDLLPLTKPRRPYAFIFGHGLWNDLDLQATLNWLDLILETALSAAPWLQSASFKSPANRIPTLQKHTPTKPSIELKATQSREFWPRLFLTPNAAGQLKPDEWLVSQGNKALMIFEESVGREVVRRGVEHLGTWNMTIQANMYDGV